MKRIVLLLAFVVIGVGAFGQYVLNPFTGQLDKVGSGGSVPWSSATIESGYLYIIYNGDTVDYYTPAANRSLIRETLLTFNVQDTSRYELVADDIGKRIKMLDTGNDTIDITSAFKAVADSGQTVSVHNLWGGTTLFRPPSGDSIKFGCDSIVSAFGTGMVEYFGNGLWYLYGKTE